MKNLLCFTGILLFAITTTYAQDCNLDENVRSYFVRANAAIEEAKKDADYLNAAEEFKKALRYAPDCPDIYYNIGRCYEKSASSGLLKDRGSYLEAINYYKKYLELKPAAQDKQTVQNRIYEMEYKIEKLNEQMISNMLAVDGRSVFMNGKKLNKDEVRSIMTNTEALRLYNKGISKNKTGNFWLGTGVFLIAIGIGGIVDLSLAGEYSAGEIIGPAAIYLVPGAGLSIIGISIKAGSKKHIRNAVNMYNSEIGKTSSTELKFGFTGNGIGLALNF